MQISRVILIEPKSDLNIKIFGKRYMAACTLPVVAATIPQRGIEVVIVDENIQPVPDELMGPSTLVGITCMTHTTEQAYKLAERARSHGSPVILGGIHPTVMPAEALRYANAVVWGEVEGLWPRILSDTTRGRLGGVYRLPKPPEITYLPMPRWDLIDQSLYWQWSATYTSRGCPHNCTFCTATSVFGKKVRYRSLVDVMRDVHWMKNHGARTLFFADDNIAASPQLLRQLCGALIQEQIKWISQCHAVVTRDEELLSLLSQSGCSCMLVGFESLALDRSVSKKMKGVDVKAAIEVFHRHGILLIGCFICGLPGETDYERLRRLINELIDVPQITVATPLPGTVDYQQAVAAGQLIGRPWNDFTVTRAVSGSPQVVQQLRRDYDQLARQVYSYRQIVRRTLRNWRQHSLYHAYVTLIVNLVYRGLVSYRDRPV